VGGKGSSGISNATTTTDKEESIPKGSNLKNIIVSEKHADANHGSRRNAPLQNSGTTGIMLVSGKHLCYQSARVQDERGGREGVAPEQGRRRRRQEPAP